MKISKISVGKEMKVGLPNYSNLTVRCDLTFDMEDGENPNWETIWDKVNQQLAIQSGHIDSTWMETGEYKNFFKTTIKFKKEGDK